MKWNEIYKRCFREIQNSTSLPMLEVAKKYFELFMKQLKDNKEFSETTWNILRKSLVYAHKRKRDGLR